MTKTKKIQPYDYDSEGDSVIHRIGAGDIIVQIVLILLSLMCLIPFALIVISSFTDETCLKMNGYSFFPEKWSVFAYTYVLSGNAGKVMHGYVVSILVTVVGTFVSILLTVLYAYPLSREDLPGRNGISFFVFFTMLFHGGLVPSYMMWTQMFHIKNTYAALIIPNLLLNAFYIIMMRTYFSSTIPTEILDACRIDGGSESRCLFSIVLPLSKPMLATLGFMTALGYWNDWLNGLYFVSDTNYYSIQNILNRMLLDIQFLASTAASQVNGGELAAHIPSTGVRMSVAVLGLLPILVAYPFFQKYLVKGIMIGGVKG